jgi:hypothetical protein
MTLARAVASVFALAAIATAPGISRAQGVARLVLVVGNNRPAAASQTPLHFADDDAIRFYERFEGLAEDRILLTRFDESSRPYAAVYPEIQPPTKAAIARAAGALRARASVLRAQGRFVELVVVFAGHGGLEGGRPYLALEDGRLRQEDLEALFLANDPADLVHVLIDACHAAGFVEARGPLRGEREPIGADTLPFGRLVERYPRVGFVVAAAAGGAAFEWSRFGGGVASHLLRSALSGAADMAPPDGRVTYDEVGAFLRSATGGVLPAEFRQEIRVIAPRALPSAAIVDLVSTERTTELVIDRPGRFYVRDADGRRIVDLNHGRGAARLLLPPYSPRFELVEVREEGAGCAGRGPRRDGDCRREEIPYAFAAGGRQRLSELASSTTTVAARGVIEDSVFEELLAHPYDAGSLSQPPGAELAAPVAPARPPHAGLGLGYRGSIGRLVAGIGPMHGLGLRLDLPVGRWLTVSGLAGFARGEATTWDAVDYPVFTIDAGVEGSVWLLRGEPSVALGLEVRWQGLDQSPPRFEKRFGSFFSAGAVARAVLHITEALDAIGGVSGGGRGGRVDGQTVLYPWAAIELGARVGL